MRRSLGILTAIALVVAACGDIGDAGEVTTTSTSTTSSTSTTTTQTTAPGTSSTTSTTTPPTTEPVDQAFVEVFFITEGPMAKPVIRAVDMPAVATGAIRELIAGPDPTEQDSELYSAVPSDTLLLGLTIEDGLATIDLSREFEAGGGSMNILSRLAQVVYTLTQFPTVDEVLFHLDGQPVDVFSGEGVILDSPVDRSDYATILPIEPGPEDGPAEVWEQSDLPSISAADPAMLSTVALVADDDVLNVRLDPTVDAPIIGKLVPGVIVERTGQEEISGSSRWVQIDTPKGGFWVNSWYLTDLVSGADFAADARVFDLLDRFVDIIRSDGDLRPVASRRGIYVSHHADPVRFGADQLDTVLTESTTYRWPSNALGTDDPEFLQIPGRTFAEAIADSFVSTYDDPDTITTLNEPIEAGNGRLPEYAIPFRLQSFNYVGVHDSGDNSDYGGLDWTTWYVSISYEDGEPLIVGLTIDQWSP